MFPLLMFLFLFVSDMVVLLFEFWAKTRLPKQRRTNVARAKIFFFNLLPPVELQKPALSTPKAKVSQRFVC